MWKWTFAALQLLLSSLVAVSTSAAETRSSSVLINDLKNQYFILKAIAVSRVKRDEDAGIERVAKEEHKTVEQVRREEEADDKKGTQSKIPISFRAKLNTCMQGHNDRYLGDFWRQFADAKTINLFSQLMFTVIQLDKDFQTSGYPENVWKPLITAFESDVLVEMIGDMSKPATTQQQYFIARSKQLLSDFNRYRLDHEKALPKVIDSGDECGAGGINVTFVPRPKGAQILIIPTMFYEYCKKQDIDPFDRQRCNRWRPVSSTISSEVAGEYHYVARWPDGAEAKGEIDFETLKDDNAKVPIDKPSVR
jgi:hypothetical protein